MHLLLSLILVNRCKMGFFNQNFGILTTVFTLVVVTLAITGKPEKNEGSDFGLTGNCSCGGFPTETPAEGAEPLLAQTPLQVPCTPDGEHTCRSMCVALAAATKAKGPQILCSLLGTANELKLAAFSKACAQPWSYSGMKAEEPLCCASSLVKQCSSATAAAGSPSPVSITL